MMTGHAKKLKKTLKKQREASKEGLLKCKSNTLKSGFLNSNNRTGKLERATRES